MSAQLAAIFDPGFFTSQIVQVAATVSAFAAIVCGTVGVFTVIRGQSFAGEALGDISTTGGSGAVLAGAGPLWGFGVAAVAASAVMELIGIQRPRGRDPAQAISSLPSRGVQIARSPPARKNATICCTASSSGKAAATSAAVTDFPLF